MAKQSSQKFIGRNRAPRVQIEYDVEIYGAEKKVKLPFVTGVMAELSGQAVEPLPPVAERRFVEFDSDNFNERMKAIRPRVVARVPNTLSGDGYLGIELTFENMDDFAPDAIAQRVEPMRKLLEARQQLNNLLTYMDGKTGAEALIARVLADPSLLQALAPQETPVDEATATKENRDE